MLVTAFFLVIYEKNIGLDFKLYIFIVHDHA